MAPALAARSRLKVAITRWYGNSYRREALREVDRLLVGPQSLPAIAELVKRVALAPFPRGQVAALMGDAWLAFLDGTGGNGRFAETRVGTAGPKRAFGDAIGLAITAFDRSDVSEKVLIVLTDGNDTGIQVPPEMAAAVAKDKGIVIHAVAVGDPNAAGQDKLDEAALRHVATVTGGRILMLGTVPS